MATIRKLEVVSPVPADIDVANSVKALHITAIAEELGLQPEEYDCYGKSKAKVIVRSMVSFSFTWGWSDEADSSTVRYV